MLRASFAPVTAGLVTRAPLFPVALGVVRTAYMLPHSGTPLCSMASISDAACVTGR